MRQVHRAGEKTFIDFSGKRPTVVDRHTGEVRSVELFVAVLGASSYTYAEATATQQFPDWVGAHSLSTGLLGPLRPDAPFAARGSRSGAAMAPTHGC